MNPELRRAFNAEMTSSTDLYRKEELGMAFQHLEIAHVLGQRYVVPHIATHYWMLKIGLRRRSLREIWGQSIRIVLGPLGSAVGIVPIGNTGGTDISMLRRLPVDPRIRNLISHE